MITEVNEVDVHNSTSARRRLEICPWKIKPAQVSLDGEPSNVNVNRLV